MRVGCRFRYSVTAPSPAVIQVEPRPDASRLLSAAWRVTPDRPLEEYVDLYGNRSRRLLMPEGTVEFAYDAVVEVPGEPDPAGPDAPQLLVQDLPTELLHYTLASRYCLSDALLPAAWELFGSTPPTYARAQAVSEWVHRNLAFEYGASDQLTTSRDVFEQRRGVCRDFAHLFVSFCRALAIPTRYVFGYLPDIGVTRDPAPMDFAAWAECWFGDRWWTFDPRNNRLRQGRVVIGRGRDAADCAMVTTYGMARFEDMVVIAEPAEGG